MVWLGGVVRGVRGVRGAELVVQPARACCASIRGAADCPPIRPRVPWLVAVALVLGGALGPGQPQPLAAEPLLTDQLAAPEAEPERTLRLIDHAIEAVDSAPDWASRTAATARRRGLQERLVVPRPPAASCPGTKGDRCAW